MQKNRFFAGRHLQKNGFFSGDRFFSQVCKTPILLRPVCKKPVFLQADRPLVRSRKWTLRVDSDAAFFVETDGRIRFTIHWIEPLLRKLSTILPAMRVNEPVRRLGPLWKNTGWQANPTAAAGHVLFSIAFFWLLQYNYLCPRLVWNFW